MNKLASKKEQERLTALHRYGILGTGKEQVYDDLTKVAARALNAPFAGISFVDESQQWFKSCAGWSLGASERNDSFCARTILDMNEALCVNDATQDRRFSRMPIVKSFPSVRSYVGIPLITPDEQLIGSFCVMDTVPREFSIEDVEILRMLARQTMSQLELRRQAMELSAANEKLRMLASCDGMTGLRNVRAFHERLEDEVRFAARNRSTLSLVLLDVDNFKNYNDQFGHPEGDIVLQAVAILLLESSREYDFVARYGGEEFAIILRGADASEAFAVAERLRSHIAGAAWPLRSITASMGVATFSSRLRTREELVAEADKLLYRSKLSGKNRVSQNDPDDLFNPGIWDSVQLSDLESLDWSRSLPTTR